MCTQPTSAGKRAPGLRVLDVIGLVLCGWLLLFHPVTVAQAPPGAAVTLTPRFAPDQKSDVLSTELELFVDPTRRMEIEDIIGQVFVPFKLLLNRSLAPTTRWLKVTVHTPAASPPALVLSVAPYFLSEIELYYEESGRWVKQLSGAKHPHLQFDCAIGRHCFTVPAAVSGTELHARVFFLRVDSVNGFYLSAQVFSEDQLVQETSLRSLIVGIQIGMLLVLIGWCAVYFLSLRSLLVGLFCLTQIVAMFLYCLTNGLILREFVSRFPESYAIMLNLAFCIRLMLAYCVAFELLRRWQTRSWFRYYFFLTMTFWLVEVIAVSFGKIVPFFLLINWLILFTAPIFGTFAIYQSETLSRSSKLYWLAGLLTICLLFGAEAFLLASGAGNSIVTLLPYSATSLLAALSIYLMLLGYTKAQQEQWLQTMFDFNVLKTQNDYEQRQLKDRSTLIDMLSHELKNPLATMRMALGSLKALFGRSENEPELNDRFLSLNQSIDNMTSVIDRVRQVDAIDQKNFVLRYEACNVIETIASLPLVVEHSDRLNILGSRQISINVDRLLFVTIINNLVDNAIKYSAPESAIEVSVSALSNNKLLCAISNAVENDHAPDATALFTRYYRGVYSHDKPGTGLGLVLIRSLCDILKGSIHYRFDYNRVFFVVELPL